ncbi:MAG: gluconate 5-dehydrogenase [Dehalococcoidia bacterium]|nr:MAG: gluconate 5-dehydrogenase [Dehalococcoidia bacterium]
MTSALDRFRLDGRIALVTGGARDLGFDIADALASAGAKVAIASREAERAELAAQRLHEATGAAVLPLVLDVRDADACARAVRTVVDWGGRLDILVNNAGGTAPDEPRPFLDRPPAAMTDLIAVNLLGTLFCSQAAVRVMAVQRSGVILNIASIAGLVGRDRRMYWQSAMAEQPVDYAAAKGGVIALTRDLAAALGPLGIRVNAISPGGFARQQPAAFIRAYADRTPLGRMGRDGVDIKGPAIFLVSDASAYITGQNLVLDGGFTAWR